MTRSLSRSCTGTQLFVLALAGAGLWFGVDIAVLLAAIWTGHIGADRLFGYGLKFQSGFEDTHLTTQPSPTALISDSK